MVVLQIASDLVSVFVVRSSEGTLAQRQSLTFSLQCLQMTELSLLSLMPTVAAAKYQSSYTNPCGWTPRYLLDLHYKVVSGHSGY